MAVQLEGEGKKISDFERESSASTKLYKWLEMNHERKRKRFIEQNMNSPKDKKSKGCIF
jgi:hypothetical protein